jgi:hypothetical protein
MSKGRDRPKVQGADLVAMPPSGAVASGGSSQGSVSNHITLHTLEVFDLDMNKSRPCTL